MKLLRNGTLVIGVLIVGTLMTLRVTGLEPGHPSAQEYLEAQRSARPGLWLTGEVVREVVTNWDFVNQFDDTFGENATSLTVSRCPPSRSISRPEPASYRCAALSSEPAAT